MKLLFVLLLIYGCTIGDLSFRLDDVGNANVIGSSNVKLDYDKIEQEWNNIKNTVVTIGEKEKEAYKNGKNKALEWLIRNKEASVSPGNPYKRYVQLLPKEDLERQKKIDDTVKQFKRLKKVDYRLILLASYMWEMGNRFTVMEGCRSIEKQRANVRKGVSKTMRSWHLKCQAYDAAPLDGRKIHWKRLDAFAFMLGQEIVLFDHIKAKYSFTGALRTGLDWDRDRSVFDTRFYDLCHREVRDDLI